LVNPQGPARLSLLALARHGDVRALLRYGVVGVAQNGLVYAFALGLIWAGLKAWQAALILYPLATAVSFAANRGWSFGDRAREPAQLRKYVFLYVAVYPCAVALNWVQEHMGVPSWLASLVTLIAGAVGMFLALNFWVFRKAA
jgi:putative flippase GtrA